MQKEIHRIQKCQGTQKHAKRKCENWKKKKVDTRNNERVRKRLQNTKHTTTHEQVQNKNDKQRVHVPLAIQKSTTTNRNTKRKNKNERSRKDNKPEHEI